MNTLTIREIFEKAKLQFDPLYIKYLLKNTGHYSITTKLSEIDIDSCVSTNILSLTKKNNYVLLIIDSDFLRYYHTKDINYNIKTFNPFNYDNKIISIELKYTLINRVFSLDNMDKAAPHYISLIMICDSNMITKNHIDEIRNYYYDFKYIVSSMILNKNYELTISCFTDNQIKNTKDYLLPNETINNCYYNNDGVLFNFNYILPNETINNCYFNNDGVLFNVNYSDLSDEIDDMHKLMNDYINIEHQFEFEKPKTIEEMELFVKKIKENPYLKLKLIT